MKNFFTVCLAVALGASVYADEIKILSIDPSVDNSMNYPLYGEAISADGKYVCGAVGLGDGVFVADAFSGEVKYQFPEIDEDGCELRGVNNAGLGIGYAINGITFSFAKDDIADLGVPKNTRGILGEGITNDGNILVGSILENFTKAAFSKNGAEWTKLPLPPNEEMLLLYAKVPEASAAKKVSGDGKVILGFIADFGVPCIWTMNDKGEYVPDLFPIRYLKFGENDLYNDERPLVGLSAHFLSLSNNGRYAAMLGLIPKDGKEYKVAVVYDTQEKSLKVYPEPQEIDEVGMGLYPSAIADDGTFIGTVGTPYFSSRGSFIMKAGQTQAELFIDAFPNFYERYGASDLYGFNVPTGISADGRYILCYTFYSDDYDDPDTPAYYETYIIDRGEGASVNQVTISNNDESIYSIDGRSLREMTKGINIIRNSDGSVRKVLKK